MQNICKCHKYEARPPRDPKEPKSDAWDEALWPRVTQQRKKENCFSPESNVIVAPLPLLLLWFCLKPPFDSQRWQDLWNLSTTWLDSACRCGCGLHWGLWLCHSRNGSCPALSFSFSLNNRRRLWQHLNNACYSLVVAAVAVAPLLLSWWKNKSANHEVEPICQAFVIDPSIPSVSEWDV